MTEQHESMRKNGKSTVDSNCAGTACRVGLQTRFLSGEVIGLIINPDEFDPLLKQNAQVVKNEADLRVGDIVRYATGNTPQH